MKTLRLLLLLLCLAMNNVYAQQTTPFIGQNIPPEGTTTIYVSFGLDRLIMVDDSAYRFEAIAFMLLTWSDPRAKPAMIKQTQEIFASNGTLQCRNPCTSLFNNVPGSLCCDNVWLPHIEVLNVRGFSQDRAVRYGIQFGEGNSSAVAWWTHLQAEFYSNLVFKAFPFDEQQLVAQFGFGNPPSSFYGFVNSTINFEQSTTSLSMYFPKSGDDISGWKVDNISMMFYKTTEQEIYEKTSPSNPNDPFPIHPPSFDDPRFVSYLWEQGFAIFIQIHRISSYYVLMSVLPIALNVWLALLVFSVSPKHLDTRLGIIITLYLALTALLYVISAGLPASSVINPIQQLCLLSYFVLGFIGLESIFVYKLVTIERQKNIKQRIKTARTTFLQRWDAIKRPKDKGTTAPDDAVQPSGCGGLIRRRRKNQSNTRVDTKPEEVALDMPPMDQQQQSKEPKKDRPRVATVAAPAKNGLEIGAGPSEQPIPGTNTRDNGPMPLSTRMSTLDYVPFGGITGGDDGSEDSQPFGGASNGSSYESSDGEQARGQLQPNENENKNWFGKQTSKFWAMIAEVRRNADYALYVALKVDTIVFWFTLIAYNACLIAILAVNSTYQAPLRF